MAAIEKQSPAMPFPGRHWIRSAPEGQGNLSLSSGQKGDPLRVRSPEEVLTLGMISRHEAAYSPRLAVVCPEARPKDALAPFEREESLKVPVAPFPVMAHHERCEVLSRMAESGSPIKRALDFPDLSLLVVMAAVPDVVEVPSFPGADASQAPVRHHLFPGRVGCKIVVEKEVPVRGRDPWRKGIGLARFAGRNSDRGQGHGNCAGCWV